MKLSPDLRGWLAVYGAAATWFLVAIDWGLPVDSATLTAQNWATDTLAPRGGIEAVQLLLGYGEPGSPQYPLFHYLVQALFVWPYHMVVRLADNIGFPAQTESEVILVLLHRLPSALLSAGTVVAGGVFVKRATGDRSAALATAGLVATAGPVVYYARTGNVDAGALFWTSVALVVAADALRKGLNVRRAVLLGLLAAAGTGSKDQQYAFFLGMAAVLAVTHLARARHHPGRTVAAVAAPLAAGLVTGLGSYGLLSGLVIAPDWFARHLDFIRHGSSGAIPEELLARVGFYYSHPATLTGYATVIGKAGLQVVAAVGIPATLVGLAGMVRTWTRDRPVAASLAFPCIAVVAGVLLPVRFVLPRFLLPIDLVICLAAGLGLAGLRRSGAVSGRAATAVTLVVVGWSAVGAADLTWQMRADARVEAAAWIEDNVEAGDTLGFYGAPIKLPTLPRRLAAVRAPGQYMADEVYGPEGPISARPHFLIVIPQQTSEPVHEWSIPDSLFAALVDGSAGYRQVLAVQTPALFARPLRVAPFVNPPVRIWVREDLVSRVTPRIELPPAPTRVP